MAKKKNTKKKNTKKRYYSKNKNIMLNTNTSAPANLPQESVIKKYPENVYSMNEDINDTIKAIDNQIKEDVTGAKRKKGSMPEKY